MSSSLIFDIKRYAINDGPGIRIVIFFKGCNLHCAWCHNPESISPKAEKMYSPAKCIGCGACVSACPHNALFLASEGVITDANLCQVCGKCAEVCPTKAIEISGRVMSVSQIMDIIEKERTFFDQSGGGVTFSGGEPLIHSEMLIELLDECRERGIHTAVDTAGNVKTEVILEVAKRTDLFLFDLKLMDGEMHKKWVGAANELIQHNLKEIANAGSEIVIRIPVIADVNDTVQNFEQTAKFISKLSGTKKVVNLLPYHNIAEAKYAKLGSNCKYQRMTEPSKATLDDAVEIFARYGIRATVGG
jgi:pyruvate formate lyase activating enzyme